MATAIDPAGVGEHGAGLANQVQRHVGQGDIFLEDGGVATPFANALTQNQAGVAQAQQVAKRRIGTNSNALHKSVLPAYMWFTAWGRT